MLREALSIAKELGSHRIIAGCIGDLAAIAAGSGQLHKAARLLGAAKKLRESIAIATGRFEAELEQETLSSLAGSLGRVTLEQAFHEGEVLTAGEAMTEALPSGLHQASPSARRLWTKRGHHHHGVPPSLTPCSANASIPTP